jgi:uracil DNA glycosylase
VGFSGRSNSHQMKGWAVITDRVRATLEDDS